MLWLDTSLILIAMIYLKISMQMSSQATTNLQKKSLAEMRGFLIKKNFRFSHARIQTFCF